MRLGSHWTTGLFWEAIEQQADGAMVVGFTTPDLDWAASTVLAYGSLVSVLEPEALRLRVMEWAGAILALYPTVANDHRQTV